MTRISRGFEFGTKLVFPYKSNIEHPMYPQNLYLACLLDPKKIPGIFCMVCVRRCFVTFFRLLVRPGISLVRHLPRNQVFFSPGVLDPRKNQSHHGPRDWEYTSCSITSLQIKTSSNGVSLPVSNFLLFLFCAFFRGCLCIHSST